MYQGFTFRLASVEEKVLLQEFLFRRPQKAIDFCFWQAVEPPFDNETGKGTRDGRGRCRGDNHEGRDKPAAVLRIAVWYVLSVSLATPLLRSQLSRLFPLSHQTCPSPPCAVCGLLPWQALWHGSHPFNCLRALAARRVWKV